MAEPNNTDADIVNAHIAAQGTAWARRVPLITVVVVVLSLVFYPFSSALGPWAPMVFLVYVPLAFGVVGAVLGMFVRKYWLGAANLIIGALVPPVILIGVYVL